MASPAPSEPSGPLGLRSLGELVDLVDGVALEDSGIHLVVTDRPTVVREAVRARLPADLTLVDMREQDGLAPVVMTPPGPDDAARGHVLSLALTPDDPDWRTLVRSLDLRREWLRVVDRASCDGCDGCDAFAGHRPRDASAGPRSDAFERPSLACTRAGSAPRDGGPLARAAAVHPVPVGR